MSADARETIVGIDEAGRGSWLGPLVVGAFCARRSDLAALRTAGARDSKLLSPSARERVYERLEQLGTCRSVDLAPEEIDRYVAHNGLNELEATAFARLVRELAPTVAYLDACDVDARRFGRRVARLAGPGTRIVARHRADRDLPVVGAASIVAKVRRDQAIRRLAESLGADIGSGYPSDRRTVDFVRRTVTAGARRPPWLRRSWATTRRVIPARTARTLDDPFP
jgi:ribonuclease HII